MPELLLELLSEEIPARMQARAADNLKRLIGESLKKDGFEFSGIETYSTPRRLTLVVDGLPTKTPDINVEKRGPKSDAPDKAVDGFAKANRVSKSDLEIRSTDKGDFYFAVIEKKGQRTAQFVPLIVETVIFNLTWPKSMRWGNSSITWVRPLHSILVIFDGKPVKGIVQLGTSYKVPGLNVGSPLEPDEKKIDFVSKTVGHRFLAPEAFTVTGLKDYQKKLKDAKVILDPAERGALIASEAGKLAGKAKLTLKPDDGLLAENAGLVEWPVVLMGRIDKAFMDLPPEVLTTVMRHHQKYFALLDGDGNLAPRFILVADTEARDGGNEIIAGNERVLRARLADAKFFRDQDRKQTLESRVPALDEIVFHEKLGRMSGKIERMRVLAGEIGARIPGCEPEQARRAALLCKADLTTEMVGEFPELQGTMGRYYALNDGKKPEVADAIAEHYAPVGPGDRCPRAPVSVAVALADKIDALVGFFGIGQRPTGSKDPFALRRAALGVIRLILENDIRLPLRKFLGQANHLYAEASAGVTWDAQPSNVLAFFADRLKVHLREKGVRHDLISAVFALTGEDDLVRLLARVDALSEFLAGDDGEHLLVAYKRAANIVRIEQKKDGKAYDGAPIAERFRQDEEKALHASLAASATASSVALEKEDFGRAMSALARLRGPVDKFFDEVTVNCDDPKLRENRLRLLSEIRATMNTVADFSKIEG
jgi:glycyl-tRNA synthetase beta chain